jgi:hypothetical protein
MTAPQDHTPEPLPIEPGHVMTHRNYERLVREAEQQGEQS